MIPAVRSERILSRTLFEVTWENATASNVETQRNSVARELFRLLPAILTVHASNQSTLPRVLNSTFVWRNDLQSSAIELQQQQPSSILEIRDTRAAAFLCDILEDKRVIRLASGAHVVWFVGGRNAEIAEYPLPDSNTRSEEELRMNVDNELWAQALQRRNDVNKWFDLYAPLQSPNQTTSKDSTPFTFDRIIAALIRATTSLASGGLKGDPFSDSLFVGAFDKRGRPGLLCSLLPILHVQIQPTAMQIVRTIAKCESVYARVLMLLYVRYRCTPENIISFFSNQPNVSSSVSGFVSESASSENAPSVFSALGKPFEKFAASPLLDNTLLQTSDGKTSTMKDIARALLLDDEVLEMWLPTYPTFAVAKLQSFIDAVAAAAENEKAQAAAALKQQQQQQDAIRPPQRPFEAQRRQREETTQASDSAMTATTSSSSSSTSTLLPGVKSIAQFAALIQEQIRQNQQAQEAEKQKEAEREAELRRQFAEATGDETKRRELHQRQAGALKERRKHEVLERLRTAAIASARASDAERTARTSATQQHQSRSNLGLGSEQSGISSASTFGGELVDPNYLNRCLAYFGSFPPPYASLPPLSLSTSVLGSAVNSGANPITALCSTTTVGTDDVFVCF